MMALSHTIYILAVDYGWKGLNRDYNIFISKKFLFVFFISSTLQFIFFLRFSSSYMFFVVILCGSVCLFFLFHFSKHLCLVFTPVFRKFAGCECCYHRKYKNAVLIILGLDLRTSIYCSNFSVNFVSNSIFVSKAFIFIQFN